METVRYYTDTLPVGREGPPRRFITVALACQDVPARLQYSILSAVQNKPMDWRQLIQQFDEQSIQVSGHMFDHLCAMEKAGLLTFDNSEKAYVTTIGMYELRLLYDGMQV